MYFEPSFHTNYYMFRIFNQPVPLYADVKQNLIRYFLVGCFVAFFLIYFQPFGTANFKMPNKSLFLSGYGWIAFLLFSLIFIGAPRIFPKYINEERWVLWKQISLLSLALLLTFITSFVYQSLWFGWTISFQRFWDFVITILPMTIFPCTFIALMDYIYHLKKNRQFADNFNQQIKPKTPDTALINFMDENGKQVFSLNSNQLIFIKAANNYVEINYLADEKIKKHLLRNSIKKVEAQIQHPSIKRSHRSYLVNIDKVGRITGNAQGYKLHFPITADFVVPVARSKGKELLAIIKK